jgi:signal peptidase I
MTRDRLAHTLLREVGFILLEEGKTLRIKADGYSMYPSIKPGSVILIEPLAEGSFPVTGEIIAWKKESGFIVHRLIKYLNKEGKRYFVTRGDSSFKEDDPEPAERIAGIVKKVEYPPGKEVPLRSFLNYSPNYGLNRFLVRIILQISRIKRIFFPAFPERS